MRSEFVGGFSRISRGVLAVLVALAALGPASPASAGQWVQNFTSTELWSGPDAGAVSFGLAQQWDYFEVVSSQSGPRLHVFVTRTGNYAFIDANKVGPSGPPPAGWPNAPAAQPAASAQTTSANQAAIGPIAGFPITADRTLWPALQVLSGVNHTWTLQALATTGTRLAWERLPPEAAAAYQPGRSLITINSRWSQSDPRALAAVIEHEAKHVADLLAGMDVSSPAGCLATEVNAFREEAKTWGELVGPNGKANPKDDLDRSLNYKLAVYRQSPDSIPTLIMRNAGYRHQCRLH